MGLSINTNIMSLNAQRNLGISQSTLAKSMQRLSSGLRINSAKDDAAGLAISDRMTSQIRGLNQAVRNANDGISLAQTAEGALQESTNILQRMRELAVQSANDTNSESDRTSLQAEVNQLKQEMGRIAVTTEFNGKRLLDGTMANAQFQIGANANETISLEIKSAKTEDLSQVGTTITAPNGTAVVGVDVTGTAMSAGAMTVNGVSVAANDGSALGLSTAINSAAGSTIATAKNVQTFTFETVTLGSFTVGVGTTPGSVTAGTDAGFTDESAVVTFSGLSGGQNYESAVVTILSLSGGQSYTVAGRTVTASGGTLTANEVAAAFANAADASSSAVTVAGAQASAIISGNVDPAHWTVAPYTNGAAVTFNSAILNTDVGNLTVTESSSVAAPTDLQEKIKIQQVVAGNASTPAQFQFVFANLSLTNGQSFTIAGRTVTATGGDLSGNEVASAFVTANTTGGNISIGNALISGGAYTAGHLANYTSSIVAGNIIRITADGNGLVDYTDIGAISTSGSGTITLQSGNNTSKHTIADVYFTALSEGQTFSLSGRTVTASGGILTAAEVAQAFATANTSSGNDSTTVTHALVSGAALTAGNLTSATIAWGGGNKATVTYNDFGDRWTTVSGSASVPTALTEGSGTSTTAGGGGFPATASSIEITGIAAPQNVNGVSLQLNGIAVAINWAAVTAVNPALTGWGPVASVADIITVLDAQTGISAVAGTTAADIRISVDTAGAPSASIPTLTTGANALIFTSGGGDYALSIDGADVTIAGEADGEVTAQDVVTAIASGVTGFSAVRNAYGTISIAKTNASNFTMAETVDPTGSGPVLTGGFVGVDSTSASTPYQGQISLNSATDILLNGAGLTAAGLSGIGNATTTIDQVDVSTRDGATTAITSVDAALAQIDSMRGELGAVQNRFESTIANLSNVSENLSSARSRILDADISQETSAMTKSNILQQAGVAILAQANQAPQLVLSLLK